MAAGKSTTIVISGNEYLVDGEMDRDSLNAAVELLNERILMYKEATQGDELRCTVLASLSFVLEQTYVEAEKKDLETTLLDAQERIEKLVGHLEAKLSQMEITSEEEKK